MSINSMNAKLAMAEKLSIPQLQQAIQSGSLPAYVGVPLIQQKMQEQKKMQAAAQLQQAEQQAQQYGLPVDKPIAQGVMEEASGIASMPSNLPVAGYSDGGIVAFAEGGEIDSDDFDYEEYLDELDQEDYADTVRQYQMASAEAAADENAGMAAINRTPSVEGGLRSLPAAAPSAAPQLPSVGRGPVSEAILKGAEAHNMPAEFLTRLAGPESSGNPNAKNPLSSAKGLFQFTDATWRQMGGEQGKQFDPYENAEKAAKLTRQNVNALANTLGRTPTYAEAGMAHRFGAGVGKMLKTVDPDTPIERGLRAFERPERVAMIMKQNPDLRGKTVGDVLGFYEKRLGTETFADGGVIRMQQGGMPSWLTRAGHVPPDTEVGKVPELPSWFRNMSGVPPERYAETIGPQGMPFSEDQPYSGYTDYGINTQEGTGYRAPVIPSKDAGVGALPKEDTIPTPPAEGASEPKTTTMTEGKPRSAFEDFMAEMKASREDLKKQQQQDKYMAILSAGLGMMSGSSPNALANIGQGAQAGLATYASSAKQRAAEKAAINKNLLAAQRYKSAEDIAAETAAVNRQRYADTLAANTLSRADAQKTKDENLQRLMLKDAQDALIDRNKQYEDALKNAFTEADKQKIEAARSKDPILQNLQKIIFAQQKKIYGDSFFGPNASSSITLPAGVRVNKVGD